MNRKQFELKREGDWVVASTPDVDRDRDRVMPLGIDLTNYRKNPVLFYGHSYADPWSLIGTAAEIEQDAAGLRIRAELREPASDTDPMHIVKALWESGLLRAASIGFQPIEAAPNEKGGRDIHRAELMEISLVPLPANQNALRMAAKAFDGAEDAPELVSDEAPFDTLLQVEQKADESPTDPPVTETEGTATPEEDAPAAVDDTAAKAEEAQAQAELRLAAILADFVDSIRPYLLQS